MTQSEQALELANRIKPLLAHHAPLVQSAALAELLSIWLAGHVVIDDPKATQDLRESMLEHHCALVRQLVEVNAKMMGID